MLTAEKVIPVTPEKQEEKMSWELTITLPKKQEEEVLLWQPYQTPKYWAYHENYTSDWFDELQDETMVEYMFRGHAMKRAPKREYHVPGEVPPVYKWGQQKIHYPGGSDYIIQLCNYPLQHHLYICDIHGDSKSIQTPFWFAKPAIWHWCPFKVG